MPFHRPIPDSKPHGKASGIVDAIVQAEKLIQIALVLPCAAFIGWLAGAWLDSRLHQSWIGLVGIVFGGASGLIYVIRLALTTDKDAGRGDNGGAGTDA
jgi:ATP synthase protein I